MNRPLTLLRFLLPALLVLGSCRSGDGERFFNQRVTLLHKDKNPYGTAAAWELLPGLFPNAQIYSDDGQPGTWNSADLTSYNQAVILFCKNFDADDEELSALIGFARQGNYIFIVSANFSANTKQNLRFTTRNLGWHESAAADSFAMRLTAPVYHDTATYVYPGSTWQNSFLVEEPGTTLTMGENSADEANFLRYYTGNGAIFVHSSPLAFSNYFVLHKNNARYLESVLSVIPASVDKVIWNEYYLSARSKKDQSEDQRGWFAALMKYRAFRWGLLTGMVLLALYLLLNGRRRQRMIPPHVRPSNDSLDFVKTLGRLYHDQRDHRNLARKMGVYFLEHVRTTYLLPTHRLDEEFVSALQAKSGYNRNELEQIVSFIRDLETTSVTEMHLAAFHKQLELFYKNT